jgi:hypothetical protein
MAPTRPEMAKMARSRRIDWRSMTPDQKLEALRIDVNVAIDLAEDLSARLQKAEALIRSLAEFVFAPKKTLP